MKRAAPPLHRPGAQPYCRSSLTPMGYEVNTRWAQQSSHVEAVLALCQEASQRAHGRMPQGDA
jgi:hypothetical protein